MGEGNFKIPVFTSETIRVGHINVSYLAAGGFRHFPQVSSNQARLRRVNFMGTTLTVRELES
jgi:hypothetical protein